MNKFEKYAEAVYIIVFNSFVSEIAFSVLHWLSEHKNTGVFSDET